MDGGQVYGIFLGTFLTLWAMRQALKSTGNDRWISLLGTTGAAGGLFIGLWMRHTESQWSLLFLVTSLLLFVATLSGSMLLPQDSRK